MQMHALRTGVIRVKNNYYDAKGTNRLERLASVLVDKQFRDIPIYTWVIEHPEGVIVIDTGETAKVNTPGYFPLLQRPYWKTQYEFLITPEDEIGPQLRSLGIPAAEVRWLVLTHVHFDHTDALYCFPNSEVIFSRKEYNDVQRFRSAHFAFPSYWPSWLKPRLIDYIAEPIGSFETSFPLTQAGDVRIVPTPGHTMGHQSIILQHDGLTFFFGGDTSFDLASLMNETIDAPAFNAHKVRETRQRILDYSKDTSLIYLTTHDHDTPHRLNMRIALQPNAVAKRQLRDKRVKTYITD